MFKRALRVNPLNIRSILGIGRALCRLENVEGAIYHYKKASAIDPNLDMAHVRLGSLYRDLERYEDAKREYLIANELWPYSHQTNYVLALICEDLNEMDRVKYHLERSLDLNPEYCHAKDRYYKRFDHYYCPSADAKEFLLNGRKLKPRQREPPRLSEKEFDIFWFDKLEMWENPNFVEYYQLFIQNGLNNIDSLFSMSMNSLKGLGIDNDEHIEIIMDAVDRIVIGEHDEFKDWIGSIVCDQQILDEYIDAFMNYNLPIYSIESFYRNASSIGKLRSIISARYGHLVSNIWQSFCDQYSCQIPHISSC